MGKFYAMKDLSLLIGGITSYLNPDVMAKKQHFSYQKHGSPFPMQ